MKAHPLSIAEVRHVRAEAVEIDDLDAAAVCDAWLAAKAAGQKTKGDRKIRRWLVAGGIDI